MADEIIKGTQVAATVVTPDPADTHPTHSDTLGRGGYRTVETIAERDAIPLARRKWGMKVVVTEDGVAANNREYVLHLGHDDNDLSNNANFKTSQSDSIHNDSFGLQGGLDNGIDAIEMFHLDESTYNKVKDLFYDVPTLSLTPATVSSGVEVGDTIALNETINISIGFPANVVDNEITFTGSTTDGAQSPIPATVAITKNVTPTARGNTEVLLAEIIRTDNGLPVTDNVNMFAEFRVCWMLFPITAGDIMNDAIISDTNLTQMIQGSFGPTAGTENTQLRSNKAIGNVTLTPSEPSNIIVMVPQSYGKPNIAPQAFPASFNATEERTFTYTNGTTETTYILRKMTDVINGAYPANIS